MLTVLFLKEEDLFRLQFLEATSSNTMVPALPTMSHHGGWHHGKRSQNETGNERERDAEATPAFLLILEELENSLHSIPHFEG